MKSIANMELDVVDAIIAGDIEKLATIVEPLSDSAKMAYIPSLDEQATKNESDFGLILWSPNVGQLRKFALYTPELAEINLAYLSRNLDKLPEEVVKIASANLTAAAFKYNLDIPENIPSEHGSDVFVDNSLDLRTIDETKYVVKTASSTDNLYALPDIKKYPIDTPEQIKKASAYFEKNNKKMDLNTQLEFALNVSKQASACEVAIENTKIAEFSNRDFDSFNPDLYEHVSVRKSYLRDNDADTKTLYDDLLRKSDEFGPTKTAQVLYEIDKKAQLTGNYGVNIENAIFASIAENDKTASLEIDGTLVNASQITAIPSSDLTSLVGNDVVEELRGDDGLHVLKSLPRPVRKEIIEIL